MNKKLVIGIIGICFIFLTGCSPSQMAMGGIKAVSIIAGDSSDDSSDSKSTIIKKYKIGENTVKLSLATYQGEPGYLFTAFDCNNQELGNIFYYAADKNDMKIYQQFKKMNQADKKQFIREYFLEYPKIDLGPIEPEAVTTAPTPAPPVSRIHVPVTPTSY